jgi:hypothetical protein
VGWGAAGGGAGQVYFLEGVSGTGLELPADGECDALRALVCEVAVGRALVAPASAGAASESTFRAVSAQTVARAGFDSIRVYDSEDGRGPQYMHVVQHPFQAIPRYVVTYSARPPPPAPRPAAPRPASALAARPRPGDGPAGGPLERSQSSPHGRLAPHAAPHAATPHAAAPHASAPHPHPTPPPAAGAAPGGGGAGVPLSAQQRQRQLLLAEEAARRRAEDAGRRARQLEAELDGVYRAERAAEVEAAAGRAQARELELEAARARESARLIEARGGGGGGARRGWLLC